MEIYILRHGIAEVAKPGAPDPERALTPEGKKKLREVLRVAKAAKVGPSLILTSPFRRAVETAEMAAEVLGYEQELVRTNALTPGSTPQEVWDEIRTHRDSDELLLAGHEPLLGHVMGYLLGTPTLLVDFKKGAICRIDMEEFGAQPRGVLRWFLVPKLAVNHAKQ